MRAPRAGAECPGPGSNRSGGAAQTAAPGRECKQPYPNGSAPCQFMAQVDSAAARKKGIRPDSRFYRVARSSSSCEDGGFPFTPTVANAVPCPALKPAAQTGFSHKGFLRARRLVLPGDRLLVRMSCRRGAE